MKQSFVNNESITPVDVDGKLPIIYSKRYDISLAKLEKLHPFDSGKWGKICAFICDSDFVNRENIIEPDEIDKEDLLLAHSNDYLKSLRWSYKVAMITEVLPLCLLPICVVDRAVLRPFRMQTGGSVLGAQLAVSRVCAGRCWAINLGGGFHHCSRDSGGGFCAYADISLAILKLRQLGMIQRAMIIDLDAHQGNGHGRDFTADPHVFILDAFNACIYPGDSTALGGISSVIRLTPYMKDAQYLPLIKNAIDEALQRFSPDFVVYNAGTDLLEGDPLGCLSISPTGVMLRDEFVFERIVRQNSIPLLMVTSGGYQRSNARIIADSILNLFQKQIIE